MSVVDTEDDAESSVDSVVEQPPTVPTSVPPPKARKPNFRLYFPFSPFIMLLTLFFHSVQVCLVLLAPLWLLKLALIALLS